MKLVSNIYPLAVVYLIQVWLLVWYKHLLFYHIELNKNENAYTNGYGLTMNIKPTGSGGSNYFIHCQKRYSYWRVFRMVTWNGEQLRYHLMNNCLKYC